MNHGLIPQQLEPKDWILGAVSALPSTVIRPDGQWDSVLPPLEVQKFPWGDSMCCITYSFLNCLETLQSAKGVTVNYSDRALAKASGTTVNGNSMRKVADTARAFGLVNQQSWKESASSREEYFKALPNQVITEASEWSKDWNVQYEIVFNYADQMCEALQYSPLQVALHAFGELKDGVYQDPHKTSNHGIMLYGYDYGKYWKVYDHYDNCFKKIAWDYNLSMIYRVNIEQRMPEPLKIANNTLCQEVEVSGQFGMYLDGNILVPGPGEDGKLALTLRMRDTNGLKPLPMTKKQWYMYPKRNLANKPL